MTSIQRSSCGVVSCCQNETANIVTSFPSSGWLPELIRRILVVASVIIPLIALIAHLSKTDFLPLIVPPSIPELRQRLRETMPTFAGLVEIYQNGHELSEILYRIKNSYVYIHELGFEHAYPEITSIQLFEKIRARLGMENEVFATPGETSPANAYPFAHFLIRNGHNSLSVRQGTIEMLCPEYNGQCEISSLSMPISEAQIESEYASYEIHVTDTIPANSSIFFGKIPHIESGALETCIVLFAYLLPPLR